MMGQTGTCASVRVLVAHGAELLPSEVPGLHARKTVYVTQKTEGCLIVDMRSLHFVHILVHNGAWGQHSKRIWFFPRNILKCSAAESSAGGPGRASHAGGAPWRLVHGDASRAGTCRVRW